MASCFRSLSKPTLSFFKSATTKPSLNPRPASSLPTIRSSLTHSRSVSQLGCVQSLLPLHSAVSSARLTSCLSIDSRSSRSLFQGMLCSANPGNWGSVCHHKRC
ncbi:protein NONRESPONDING TO OXYLIPINS 2, mitochondrial isoform X2 [Ziziphus jujuba]|uniref:Protein NONRESPONDING TO OXYLIPINS 2, mitochondrial isoform X2 n=1 Tax=Ziziphus jujuba TaxID=326968 RepID=A0ABM4AAH5_ZIZJJ|nr:protein NONRESPONDING TO OXYLIPINS 2, mitochondrial isoform X2 [Ziziphus jujuba]